MLILIDSGVSHKFISTDLVAKLGLVVEETPPYKVCLGDEHRKTTSGCCHNVIIQRGEPRGKREILCLNWEEWTSFWEWHGWLHWGKSRLIGKT